MADTVRPGRTICRGCSASPESIAEKRAMQRVGAVMAQLQAQSVVRSYNIIKNRKLSVAELASVGKVSKAPLRWDITVLAKVGAADDNEGLQTQLVHIELDGRQHFRFSKLWHKENQAVYRRSLDCDNIKDNIVLRSATSRYGKRFKRVSLLRVALVKPSPSGQQRRQRMRDTKRAINKVTDKNLSSPPNTSVLFI